MKIKYPLSISNWDNKEKNAIKSIIDKDFHTMGTETLKFEKSFSEWLGRKYSVMVNSGSSANLLSAFTYKYKSKNFNNPGNVLLPAVSWSTTYFPFAQAGFNLHIVDIDKETFNIDCSKIEKILKSKVIDIICSVNILGNPADYEKLKYYSKKYNCKIFEDNCESMGAKYKNKKTGTFGDMSTHSFFFSHHICTIEGGIISTDDLKNYEYLKILRSHGWVRDINSKRQKSYLGKVNNFNKQFKFVLPGFNVRPIEIESAIGKQQIKKLDKFLKIRRKNYNYFKKKFLSIKEIYIQKETYESSSFGFAIIIKDIKKYPRIKLIELLKKNNIDSRPIIAGNFFNNPAIKFMNIKKYSKLKNAEILDKNGFFLGCYNKPMKTQIDHAYKIISKYFSN